MRQKGTWMHRQAALNEPAGPDRRKGGRGWMSGWMMPWLVAALLGGACTPPEDEDVTVVPPTQTGPQDADEDGFSPEDGDCNDNDDQIHPDAEEVCDGVDNNCADGVDEGVGGQWYPDQDQDGYGAMQDPIQACEAPTGAVENTDDCDDSQEAINPDATELCDTLDNNCDGVVDADAVDRQVFYPDQDEDGFGDGGKGEKACSAPQGWVEDSSDCDDTNADTFPGASEVCNSVDDDCDNQVDEEVTNTYFADLDEDGFGDPEAILEACAPSEGYIVDGSDCDDSLFDVHPGGLEACNGLDDDCDGQVDEDSQSIYYLDGDEDGYGNPSRSVEACTAPAGYVMDNTDCKDTNDSIHPNAQETCNSLDDDCDLEIDEGAASTYHPDADLDGFGDPSLSADSCQLPPGYVPDGSDCDDSQASVNPRAPEKPYDGVDQNCDGLDETDVDEDGVEAVQVGGLDCDDEDAQSYPGALELPYDGIDQSCDGKDLTDVDGDGFDATAAGGQDCLDDDVSSYPGASEYADGKDNDCDGKVDEDLSTTDDDKDGYSEANGDCRDNDPKSYPGATEVAYDGIDQSCDGKDLTDVDKDGYDATVVAEGTDCDDNNAAVNPGQSEVAYDGIDQDCAGGDLVDVDGDGFASTQVDGGLDCDDARAEVNPAALEVCNGQDEDCDGKIDDGVTSVWYADGDKDGYGDASRSKQACTQPAGYVADGSDCDDLDSAINPGAKESCNGEDDNCNSQVDEGVLTTWYRDADGDGYGNPSKSTIACKAPAGYVTTSNDCDDTKASVNPGAADVCDDLDNNCDGQVDEGLSSTWYADQDRDGYGNPNSSLQDCTQPPSYVTDNTDCDDSRATVNPKATETCNGVDDDCDGQTDEGLAILYYKDYDGDTYGNPQSSQQACSKPTGYVTNNTDCDDTRATVYPGAKETCNGIDDDCDTQVDEGVSVTWYKDGDADGYGTSQTTQQACNQPAGYVSNSTDCDDTKASVKPGASESCNQVDDDCDTQVDEGVQITYYQDSDKDTYGNAAATTLACTVPAGYVARAGDCDDTKASVSPAAAESCNLIDDDCDGQVDEGVKTTYYADGDGDGWGVSSTTQQACSAPQGYAAKSGDCSDTVASVNPGATESCNGVDDDCDSQIDEGVKTTYYADGDTDGYGNPNSATQACTQPAGYVTNKQDCNDRDKAINPAGTETCNGVDEDCDGLVDDGFTFVTWYEDADGDTYGNPLATAYTCFQPTNYVLDSADCNDLDPNINPDGIDTVVDGADGDCDGYKDLVFREAGIGPYNGDVAATSTSLGSPYLVAFDGAGNLYIPEYTTHRVRKVNLTTGAVVTVAGSGIPGSSGDGAAATLARLYNPTAVTVDALGNLFIADMSNSRVRRVDPSGNIYTVAGSSSAGFAGDGGPATLARLYNPGGLATDSSGNLYIADTYNHRVRKVDASGNISTVAGADGYGFSGDGGPATKALLYYPRGLAFDGNGGLYIADAYNHRIRRVDTSGNISTVAGSSTSGYAGDAGQATLAKLYYPYAVALDGSANLYIADSSNYRVRKVSSSGIITTAAGTGTSGFSGDGGAATLANLSTTYGVSVDSQGTLFIADTSNNRIRRVVSSVIYTAVGTSPSGYNGDGLNATKATLSSPYDVALDASGNLYIADYGNSRVRKISPTGTITTLAGTGTTGYSGDGGPATLANLGRPTGLAVDSSGAVYIADYSYHRIRKVSGGVITLVAGTASAGYSGDGGPATAAWLYYPFGIAVNASGELFIADTYNHRIRKVAKDGTINTFAGNGNYGFAGDGGQASLARLYYPYDVAVDGSDNVLIADYNNYRVRKVDASGIITTVAGNGGSSSTGDGGPATSASIYAPTGLAIDDDGNYWISEYQYHRIRRVSPTGIINTVVGTGGTQNYPVDGSTGLVTSLYGPWGLAVDGEGILYIAEISNHRISAVLP